MILILHRSLKLELCLSSNLEIPHDNNNRSSSTSESYLCSGLNRLVWGIPCLLVAAVVTFYSYNLLSLVLEHYADIGQRQLRFLDMARDVLGPGWGRYFVGPIQFGLCYGAVVALTLLGGQSLKRWQFIYFLSRPDGTMH